MLKLFVPIGLSLAGVYGLAFQIANWVNAGESFSRSQGFALFMLCSCLVNSLLWLPRGWAGLRNFSLLFLLQGAGIAAIWGVTFVLAVMAMGGPGVTAQQGEANLRLLNGASLLAHLAASHLSCYLVTVVGKRNRSSAGRSRKGRAILEQTLADYPKDPWSYIALAEAVPVTQKPPPPPPGGRAERLAFP